MKGKSTFRGYTDKDARRSRERNGQYSRHNWSVRACKMLPQGYYEVFIFDDDIPYAQAWLPLDDSGDVLPASLTPNWPTDEAAMAAYAAAAVPTGEHMQRLSVHLQVVAFRHLLRLAPGVTYVEPIPSERQLGES